MSTDEHFVDMTVIVQDPSRTIAGTNDWPLTAPVRVPVDRLEPGPRSHRFHVVDIDLAEQTGIPPAVLADDTGWAYVDRFRPGKVSKITALTNSEFIAQNVYAIATRTLAVFERGLGRRVPWAIPSPVLNLVPRAIAEANAYYSRDDHASLFGYTPDTAATKRVLTSLSHDVIAHEVTHAILDGLRPRFMEPGLPDQPAFHEALADLVALLSVLAVQELVDHLIVDPAAPDGYVYVSALAPAKLRKNALFTLAEQLGTALHDGRKEALRRSLETVPRDPSWSDPERHPEYLRPHRRAEVVVAAVMEAFLTIWSQRNEPYRNASTQHDDAGHRVIDRGRVAEEGAKAAEHLLKMIVRACDYLPPVELEYADVIEAILVADEVIVPDDRYDYRSTLLNSFATFGIAPPDPNMTANAHRGELDYRFLTVTALATSHEEAYRFIWQNMHALGLHSHIHVVVDRVITTTRTGPYGLVVTEIVADYSQALDVPAGKLGALGIDDSGLPADTMVQLWGGGVLVFDQFGRLRQHKAKYIVDPDGTDNTASDRQTRRLRYLVDNNLVGRDGSYGASMNIPRGERFTSLHTEEGDESW